MQERAFSLVLLSPPQPRTGEDARAYIFRTLSPIVGVFLGEMDRRPLHDAAATAQQVNDENYKRYH